MIVYENVMNLVRIKAGMGIKIIDCLGHLASLFLNVHYHAEVN